MKTSFSFLLALGVAAVLLAACPPAQAADYLADQAIDKELGLLSTKKWAVSPTKFLNFGGTPAIFGSAPPYFQQPFDPSSQRPAPTPVVKVEPRSRTVFAPVKTSGTTTTTP